jgi:Zn-dependent peptidase ImmA (M78 family)
MNGRAEVCTQAEAFRAKHLCEEIDRIPVDILTLCEITLRIDVIPFEGLLDKYKIDAGILPDFSGIYVDKEAYILWEKGPIWRQNRLRFSVGHELGHYALHQEIVKKRNITTFEELRDWLSDERFAAEQEANEFAGRLLVPMARLEKFYDDFENEFEPAFPNWREHMGFREKFIDRVSPKFGVNSDVINIRLDREGLWPAN